MTVACRILPGLPPYGPPALSFPDPNAFREGLVVEFETATGDRWVGNFLGSLGGADAVLVEFGERAIVVVASGRGFVVDAVARRVVRDMGADIQHIWFESDFGLMIASNGLWFEAFDAISVRWTSRRVSWDGLRGIERRAAMIVGEAYSPIDDTWHAFELDIESGEVFGGSYDGPPMAI